MIELLSANLRVVDLISTGHFVDAVCKPLTRSTSVGYTLGILIHLQDPGNANNGQLAIKVSVSIRLGDERFEVIP